MTIAEAARLLMLSRNHVLTLVTTGEILGSKVQRGRRAVYWLDDESVMEWKRKRPSRPEKRGAAWRKGMLLTRRQWRCSECGTICQKDLHKQCRNCGKLRKGK